MSCLPRGGPLTAVLFLLASAEPSWAQPQPVPVPDAIPPPPPSREQSIEQLRQAIEQLRNATEVVGQQLQTLEAQLQTASQLPAAGGGAPSPESSREITALREELAQLRNRVDELGSQQTEQHEAVLEDMERRAILSGILAPHLRIPEHGDPYFRAFAVILLLNAQISPRLRFYGEIEFEDAAAVGEGEGAVEVEQGFGEFIAAPAIGFRLGILLVPFGSFNRRHEEWRQPFSMRPLINNLVFPSTYSDVGAEIFGTLLRTENLQVNYEIAIVNGLTSGIMTENLGEPYGLREAKPSFGEDNNAGKSYTGRFGFAIGEQLELGLSGYWGPYADAGAPGHWAVSFLGGDAQLSSEHAILRVEAIYGHLDQGYAELDDDDDPSTPDVRDAYLRSMVGAVAEAEIRFWPDFLKETPLGEFPDPHLYIAGRFDVARISFPNSRSTGYGLVGALGYRPVERSALRLEFAKAFGELPEGGESVGGAPGGDSWVASVSFALGF